jgi:hypothetical protein
MPCVAANPADNIGGKVALLRAIVFAMANLTAYQKF